MTSAIESLVHRWFEEVWNRGNHHVIDEMMAGDCLIYGLTEDPDTPLVGSAGFKRLLERVRSAFPDLKIVVDDLCCEDNKATARCTVRGTHLGEGLGFPTSKAKVEFTGMTMATIEKGRFVRSWNNFDLLTLFTQIGMIRGPST